MGRESEAENGRQLEIMMYQREMEILAGSTMEGVWGEICTMEKSHLNLIVKVSLAMTVTSESLHGEEREGGQVLGRVLGRGSSRKKRVMWRQSARHQHTWHLQGLGGKPKRRGQGDQRSEQREDIKGVNHGDFGAHKML